MSWYWWPYLAVAFICIGGMIEGDEGPWERLGVIVTGLAWPVAILMVIGMELRKRGDS